MENLFRSPRLVYRAVEETAEDEAFIHAIQTDVVAFANSDNGLLKPLTKKDTAKHMTYVAEKTLIGVIICLAPPTASPPTTTASTATPPVPIGCMYLTAPGSGQEHHRNSYISIDIIGPYQRQGYGSEAIRWIVDWGFRMAGLHRIGIECFSYNAGAKELYERLGFIQDGRKRECLWHNGGWHDFLSFSMLEHEWRASRGH